MDAGSPIAATASDANRFAIRVARAVTGRARLLVFDGCYHGAVDDTPQATYLAAAKLLDDLGVA